MVQAVNPKAAAPARRPDTHSRRYVLALQALLGSRWLLNPAPSALWEPTEWAREGKPGAPCGWGGGRRQPGGVSCGSCVATGVPRPGRVPPRRPRAGPLVAWTTSRLKVSAPVTQCTSFALSPDLKSDWPRFGHSVPGAARRAQAWGGGVWSGSDEAWLQRSWWAAGLGSLSGDSRWAGVLESHRGRGRTHRRSRRRSRNSEQVRTSVCQCLGGSCRPRARSCDAGLQGGTRAQCRLCQLGAQHS